LIKKQFKFQEKQQPKLQQQKQLAKEFKEESRSQLKICEQEIFPQLKKTQFESKLK